MIEENILNILPSKLNVFFNGYKDAGIQEIRIKIDKPIIIYTNKGEVISNIDINREDFNFIIKRIANYSIYAYEEELKQGFITLKGGHRVGLAGECVIENNKIKTIKNISSINIRISREVIGCARKVMKFIVEHNRVKNTLIISPPKCGKTTILRDISRIISSGDFKENLSGKKVVVIDERSEIGGSYLGIPQMNLGIRTDILDNCLKKEGMIMAIRSLSPDVLICDEIGTEDDVKALNTAFNSGVNIIVTVHGSSLSDIQERKAFYNLFDNGIIERVIILSNKNGVGTIEKVYSIKKDGEISCLN